MDRVHRLGQTRPVTVVRYVCDDTLETRLLKMQVSRPFEGRGRGLARDAATGTSHQLSEYTDGSTLLLALSLSPLAVLSPAGGEKRARAGRAEEAVC
jgi:hypothetical protein